MATDEAGNPDKSYSGVTDESMIQMNISDISQTLQSETLDNSTISVEKSLAMGADVSAEQTQKKNRSKSAKTRPVCLICNKTFHTRYKLNEHHAIVHLDKRLFSCNVCQKTFGRADHLIRHVKHRVCVPREHQQLLDLMDASGKPGNWSVL